MSNVNTNKVTLINGLAVQTWTVSIKNHQLIAMWDGEEVVLQIPLAGVTASGMAGETLYTATKEAINIYRLQIKDGDIVAVSYGVLPQYDLIIEIVADVFAFATMDMHGEVKIYRENEIPVDATQGDWSVETKFLVDVTSTKVIRQGDDFRVVGV